MFLADNKKDIFVEAEVILDHLKSKIVSNSEVKTEVFDDSIETGHRLRYQLAELVAYFGWPLFTVWLVRVLSPNLPLAWVAVCGVALLVWPYIKGRVGGLLAAVRKIKDPRHGIRSSSFWYDGFLFIGSPALREIRKYSALSRSLDIIYNIFGRFGVRPQNFPSEYWDKMTPFRALNTIIKAWTFFWTGMPIAQDVRSRLEIIAEEYCKTIGALARENPGRTIRILEIAGGQLQAVVMGIARAIKSGSDFDYRVVSIEPDYIFARHRASELISHFGLKKEYFEFIGQGISTNNQKKYLRNILSESGKTGFDIVVCVGLGDYYYTRERIDNLLAHILDCGLSATKIITANISDNLIERWFLHLLIQWPKMKYRSLNEWTNILSGIFGNRKIRIVQTPHKIFNIAVIERE